MHSLSISQFIRQYIHIYEHNKFATKSCLNIPPRLALNVRELETVWKCIAINDKSLGSIGKHLACAGLVYNKFRPNYSFTFTTARENHDVDHMSELHISHGSVVTFAGVADKLSQHSARFCVINFWSRFICDSTQSVAVPDWGRAEQARIVDMPLNLAVLLTL